MLGVCRTRGGYCPPPLSFTRPHRLFSPRRGKEREGERTIIEHTSIVGRRMSDDGYDGDKWSDVPEEVINEIIRNDILRRELKGATVVDKSSKAYPPPVATAGRRAQDGDFVLGSFSRALQGGAPLAGVGQELHRRGENR